nr:MAG TPA: DNA helix destabilizing protein [Caudoviricetes sp.]
MAKVVDKIVDVMTPVGESVFCKINGIVDDYMGQNKYTITMTLGEKEAKALQKQLVKIWEQSETFKSRNEDEKETDRPKIPITKSKEYGYQLKASTKTEFIDKNGNTKQNVVSLVDGHKKPLDAKTQIWKGSKVALWIGAKPYETPTMYGVSLKLKGIQVIELVNGGSGGAFGGSASDDVQSFGTSSMAEAFDTPVEDTDSDAIPF